MILKYKDDFGYWVLIPNVVTPKYGSFELTKDEYISYLEQNGNGCIIIKEEKPIKEEKTMYGYIQCLIDEEPYELFTNSEMYLLSDNGQTIDKIN